MTRISTRLALTPQATRVHAPARAEIPLSLAGRARAVWERLTGAPAVSGRPASIPPNPQGSVGDDYSGPPFGAAQRITVWSWAGRGSTSAHSPRTILQSATGLALRDQEVWVRPFAPLQPPLVAPYGRLHLLLRLGAVGSGATGYRVDLRCATTGSATSATLSINAATADVADAALWITAQPGRCVFDLELTRTSGTRALELISAALYVRAKRGHGLAFPG
jgi:hypothetical protein